MEKQGRFLEMVEKNCAQNKIFIPQKSRLLLH